MRVEYSNPEMLDGTEVDIGGLLFINGESVEIDEEQADLFEAKTGVSLRNALASVQFARVDGVSYVPASAPTEVVDEPQETNEEVGDE